MEQINENVKEPPVFQSHIKDLWLELPNYEFETDVGVNPNNRKWISRNKIEARLLNYLEASCNTGAYLITGYRGMGKTTFVKKVTQLYKNKSRKAVKIVTISFGQKDVKELDILRQILQGIKEHLLDERIEWFHTKLLNLKSLPFWSCLVFILMLVFGRIGITATTSNIDFLKTIASLLILATVIAYFFLQLFIFIFKLFFYRVRIYDKVTDLFERSNSQVTTEAGATGTNSRFPFNFVNKLIKQYPIANPKEVENEIIAILTRINNVYPPNKIAAISTCIIAIVCTAIYIYNILRPIEINFTPQSIDWQNIGRTSVSLILCIVVMSGAIILFKKLRDFKLIFRHRKFVFVFDEIDKIDPSPHMEGYHENLDNFEKLKNGSDVYESRTRRRVVINILANLKYLITTAEAKFIFIAGREMFDAALADISDRQSAISSIFHQVINVDSFLKEESQKSNQGSESGITLLIEDYLERILLPETQYAGVPFLKRYHSYLESQKIDFEVRYKIIYTLDRFITFLTYRSNGSPKKLVRLIEDIIQPKVCSSERIFNEDLHSLIVLNDKISSSRDNTVETKRYFLYFDRAVQYKIGFITYLTKPFLVSFGNYFKEYSEKILVATPYLFDHIIKFHSFAFSLHNLELVPEVISETRPPELRSFLETLVTYLGQTHIRETEIGLFEYRFLNKTLHEISYLSKIYEDESAAFNFTLDETYQVKLFIRNKIKELRSIYKHFTNDNNTDPINSILFLNAQVGDLHFFDQEYDEAIVAYYDALQVLESRLSKNENNNRSFSIENFIRYLQLKLKIGLTFEKMKSYETAIAIYSETSVFATEFLRSNKANSQHVSSLPDFIQILVQPLLAEAFIQEKLSAEGVNIHKISKSEDLFCILMQLTGEGTNNFLIKSNFYSHLSTLLFYKNSFELSFKVKSTTSIAAPESRIDSFQWLFPSAQRTGFQATGIDYRVSNTSFACIIESLVALLNYLDDSISSTSSLLTLLKYSEDFLSKFIDSDYIIRIDRFEPKNYKNDKTIFKNFGLILSKLADIIFSGISVTRIDLHNDHDQSTILHSNVFIKSKSDHTDSKYWSFHSFSESVVSQSYNFQLVICTYFWAANFFSRAGKNTHVSFMYRKIFHVFHLVASFKTISIYLNQMENFFLRELLKATTWNSNSSDRYQIFTFKNILNITEAHHPIEKSKHDYLNTSTSPEVKEAVILYSLLQNAALRYELKEAKDILNTAVSTGSNSEKASHFSSYNKTLQNIFQRRDNISKLISPYNTISSQYSRYLEFSLQLKINESIDHNNDKLKDIFIAWNKVIWAKSKNLYKEKELSRRELRNSIIGDLRARICSITDSEIIPTDLTIPGYLIEEVKRKNFEGIFKKSANSIIHSIYCLKSIIKIYNDIGVNPFFSYSSLGYYHEKLGHCIRKFELLKFISEYLSDLAIKRTFLSDTLIVAKQLLGAEFVNTMDSITQYQFAIQNYSKARQFQNDGVPYKTFILNMYYLEDDFNDALYHFGISVERQRMSSGDLRRKITRMQDEIRESQLYKYVSYVNDY